MEDKKLQQQEWEVAYDGVHVMGAKYRLPAVLDVLEAYDAGQRVDLALEPEPENKHDHNAIRVVAAPDKHIGYLPAVLAETIAYRRLATLRAEFVGADIDDQLRVKIEIRVLTPA